MQVYREAGSTDRSIARRGGGGRHLAQRPV